MPHEVGLWLAVNGQDALASSSLHEGFYTNPVIVHAYYSFLSNGVQSLAIFAEHVGETRTRDERWTYFTYPDKQGSYPATVDEQLSMTTLGLETFRTLWTAGDFRLAGGLGLGYALGGASIRVHNDSTGAVNTYNALDGESGLFIDAAIRVRYTIYTSDNYEIAIAALGRYWSFPTIGPSSESAESYNGPSTRVLSELGYLAGISVGF